jgi:hypothetical protein
MKEIEQKEKEAWEKLEESERKLK